MKQQKLRRRKGGALAWVLIAMALVTFIGATITLFMEANLQQSVGQEKDMMAYYTCQSGMNLGVAALLTPNGVKADGTDDTLLDQLGRKAVTGTLTHTETIGDDGAVDITLKLSADGKWVEVNCVGTVTYRSKPYTNTGTLRVSVADQSIVRQPG